MLRLQVVDKIDSGLWVHWLRGEEKQKLLFFASQPEVWADKDKGEKGAKGDSAWWKKWKKDGRKRVFFIWPVAWADSTGSTTWHGRDNCEPTVLSQPALFYFTHMQLQNWEHLNCAHCVNQLLTPSKASGMRLSHTYQMLNNVVVKRNKGKTNRFSDRYSAGISVWTDLRKNKKTIVDVCCLYT